MIFYSESKGKSQGPKVGTAQAIANQTWERRAEALRLWLVSLASTFISELEDVHWAGGGDEGISYCRAHATEVVEALKAAKPESEDLYRVDGGYRVSEEDTVATCEKCGKLLRYSLTRFGVKYELDHYESVRISYADLKKYPGTCYELAEIIDSGRWYLEVSEEPEIAARLKQLVRRLEAIQHRAQSH